MRFSGSILLIYNKTFQRHGLLFAREAEEDAKIHIYKLDQYQLSNALNLDTLVMCYQLVVTVQAENLEMKKQMMYS